MRNGFPFNTAERWMLGMVGVASLVALAARLRPDAVDVTLAGSATGLALALGAWLLVYALGRRLLHVPIAAWCDEPTRAHQRYQRVMAPAMAMYALTLFASVALVKRGLEPASLRAAVALLPMVPVGVVAWAMVRYLREVDEMQQRVETLAICMAALIVSLTYFAGGLLHAAKVMSFDAGAVMLWVFPLLCLVYGIAKLVIQRRYR